MSNSIKHREFIGIIKSGMVGAFTLMGVVVILVIIAQRSPVMISLVDAVFKTVPSVAGLLIITGGIGFILGLGLRRSIPIIQTRRWPLVVSFVILAIPLGFIARVLHNAAMEVEYPPQQLKLADCSNNVVSFHLDVPIGHDHQLQLRMPESQTGLYKVSGQVRILSGGSLLTNMAIGSGLSWSGGMTIVGV